MDKENKIKNIILQHKRWGIAVITIIIFTIIARNVLMKELFEFDSIVYQFLVANRNDVLNTVFQIITQLGSATCLVIISIICVIIIKNKKYKITIPANLAIIGALNYILKDVFNRPRPNELRIIDEWGYSFPSGHSMASMAFYGYFIYLIYKNVKNKKLRNTLCIILSILILLIGISRIYLGVHYASDVIAGLCFSVAYLIIMISTGVYR